MITQWQRTLLKQNAGKLAELGLAEFQDVLTLLFPLMTVEQLRLVDRYLVQEVTRRGPSIRA